MKSRPKTCLLAFVLLFLQFAVPAVWAQALPPEPAPAAPAEPRLQPIQSGPLEITPIGATLLLKHDGHRLFLHPVIRFRIKNISPSDIKIILFASTIGATEPSGQKLFPDYYVYYRGYGIMLSKQEPDKLDKAFTEEKGKFVTLAPQQAFEVQITIEDREVRRIDDKQNELFRSFRPKEITFAATIGIINLDETTEKRAFSFSHLPIRVTTR